MTIKCFSKMIPLLLSFSLLFSLTACGGGGGAGGDNEDSTVPNLTAFSIPPTSSSLIVDITSFTASDNVGVTGYCLAETNSSSSCTWKETSPGNYSFSADGSKILYAFARDAAGNISNNINASTLITLTDISTPTVTAFTIPATSTSFTVDINSFTADDSVDVTGYCLAESDDSGDCTWNNDVPSAYTFTTAGDKILYAFARDAAGNISNSLSAPISLIITANLTIGIQKKDQTQGTNVGSVDLNITLPASFVLPNTSNLPNTMTSLVSGLNLQQGVNYTHPTLILSLIKGDGSVFSTGSLVRFTYELQGGEALPLLSDFLLDLMEVSEISADGLSTPIQTDQYEVTLTLEEI